MNHFKKEFNALYTFYIVEEEAFIRSFQLNNNNTDNNSNDAHPEILVYIRYCYVYVFPYFSMKKVTYFRNSFMLIYYLQLPANHFSSVLKYSARVPTFVFELSDTEDPPKPSKRDPFKMRSTQKGKYCLIISNSFHKI